MSAYANSPAPIRVHEAPVHVSGLLEEFISQLAERVAARIAEQARTPSDGADEWFDSRHAAEYLEGL